MCYLRMILCPQIELVSFYGYDISILVSILKLMRRLLHSLLRVEVQHSPRQSIYLVACLFKQGSQCFSRPPALSHDLSGREQQPTGESVDTARDQKHKTLGLLWAKPLEASCKDKVNINLKNKKKFSG